MDPVAALPLVATCFAVPQFLPQAIRFRRTRDAAGVSSLAIALTCVNNAAWLTYFVGRGHAAAIVTNGSVIVVTFGLLVMLGRAGHLDRRVALGAAGWGSVLFAVRVLGGTGALGMILAAAFVIQSVPALRAAHRTEVPSGVAVGTWWLIGAELACWGAFGVLRRDLTVISLGVCGIVIAGSMIRRASGLRLTGSAAVSGPVPTSGRVLTR